MLRSISHQWQLWTYSDEYDSYDDDDGYNDDDDNPD